MGSNPTTPTTGRDGFLFSGGRLRGSRIVPCGARFSRLAQQGSAAGYDGLDRLTSASYPTALGLPASETFGYDAAGNREDPADPNLYQYDANNRIQASPGKAWVYDDDGNPESVNAGLSDEETFTYDSGNRLRQYTDATTSTTASYLYDPFGRRIKKTVDGTTTWFVWDGDQLLGEFDGSGNRQRRYAYTGGFAPAEQVEAGSPETVSQVHTDHLDTPRALTSSAAAAVWRGAYQAFGTVAIGTSTVSHEIRFPGQYADGESGLYYNRYRDHASTLGRYLQPDPIGQYGVLAAGEGDEGAIREAVVGVAPLVPIVHTRGGTISNKRPAEVPTPYGDPTNVFVYGASRPLRFIDPLGLWSWTFQGGFGPAFRFTGGFDANGDVFVEGGFGVGVGLDFGLDPLGQPLPAECDEGDDGTIGVTLLLTAGYGWGPVGGDARASASGVLNLPACGCASASAGGDMNPLGLLRKRWGGFAGALVNGSWFAGNRVRYRVVR